MEFVSGFVVQINVALCCYSRCSIVADGLSDLFTVGRCQVVDIVMLFSVVVMLSSVVVVLSSVVVAFPSIVLISLLMIVVVFCLCRSSTFSILDLSSLSCL